MRLYLVQHGDALSEEVDPVRRLSERGKADAGRLADFLAGAGVSFSLVIHSGKKRAEQTARLLAAKVSPSADIKVAPDIAPMDDICAFKKRVPGLKGDTLVVGHLPFMGKLVSSLVCGKKDIPIVSFRPGTIVCLDQGEDGGWLIIGMIRPHLLRR